MIRRVTMCVRVCICICINICIRVQYLVRLWESRDLNMYMYRCVQLYLVQIPYDPMSVYMYKYVCVYIGGLEGSPVGKSASFRSCVRASERSCRNIPRRQIQPGFEKNLKHFPYGHPPLGWGV